MSAAMVSLTGLRSIPVAAVRFLQWWHPGVRARSQARHSLNPGRPLTRTTVVPGAAVSPASASNAASMSASSGTSEATIKLCWATE